MPRNKITVTLGDLEFAQIQSQAAQRGMGISTYARILLTDMSLKDAFTMAAQKMNGFNEQRDYALALCTEVAIFLKAQADPEWQNPLSDKLRERALKFKEG